MAIAIIAGSLVLITGFRFAVTEPGPLYLVPAVLAGFWLGIRPALIVAAVAALLWLITHGGGDGVLGGVARFGIYGAAGALVGWLAESRIQLSEQLRRRNLQLEELRSIQEALAPSEPPQRPALELATCYLPAEKGVSGDFFLVVPGVDDSTVIAVGDVAGRGLEAAKRAWYVRTLIATSAEVTGDPAQMLEQANRALVDDAGFASPFITVACVHFRPNGRTEWALAGHDDPIDLKQGAILDGGGVRGLPLGVAEKLGCETATASLDGGSGLLLYTDGLTEARRTNGSGGGLELFGEERVAELVSRLPDSTPNEIVERVQAEVSRFSGGKLADDLCLVALRASGEPDSTQVC